MIKDQQARIGLPPLESEHIRSVTYRFIDSGQTGRITICARPPEMGVCSFNKEYSFGGRASVLLQKATITARRCTMSTELSGRLGVIMTHCHFTCFVPLPVTNAPLTSHVPIPVTRMSADIDGCLFGVRVAGEQRRPRVDRVAIATTQKHLCPKTIPSERKHNQALTQDDC